MHFIEPDYNCSRCPRLHSFICDNRIKYPDKYNGPVPSFGSLEAQLLIVGLAPGLKGANFTGRPFTGDYAGDLLYPTLLKFNFALGDYGASPQDGLTLKNTRITNAVRCVPPQNKPDTSEINQCLPFLSDEIAAMKNLKIILSLGGVSHKSVLKALGYKQSKASFTHGAFHRLDNDLTLVDSYHCSRYNTNTGRLTTAMFEHVLRDIKEALRS